MAEPLDEAFVGLVKFLFKLVVYWPIKILWFFGSWFIEEAHRWYVRRRGEAHTKRQNEEREQRDLNRRSRNTLYDGPKQPNT